MNINIGLNQESLSLHMDIATSAIVFSYGLHEENLTQHTNSGAPKSIHMCLYQNHTCYKHSFCGQIFSF